MTCAEGDFPEAAVGENWNGKKRSTNTHLGHLHSKKSYKPCEKIPGWYCAIKVGICTSTVAKIFFFPWGTVHCALWQRACTIFTVIGPADENQRTFPERVKKLESSREKGSNRSHGYKTWVLFFSSKKKEKKTPAWKWHPPFLITPQKYLLPKKCLLWEIKLGCNTFTN